MKITADPPVAERSSRAAFTSSQRPRTLTMSPRRTRTAGIRLPLLGTTTTCVLPNIRVASRSRCEEFWRPPTATEPLADLRAVPGRVTATRRVAGVGCLCPPRVCKLPFMLRWIR